MLCGSGASAVNGISLGDDIAIPGTNIKVVGQESFHPNSHGYELEAGVLLDEYGELDTYPNYNCLEVESGYCPDANVTAPSIASYFGVSSQSGVVDTKTMTSPTLFQRLLQLSLSGLRGLTFVRGTIYSEERSLGTYQVNTDGTLNRTIELPAGLEPGYHTIYFSGTLESGEPFEYQQVILYIPPETKTGPCGILPYSNIDQDADGIDDACDPSIDVDAPILLEDPSTVLIYPNRANATESESDHGNTSSNKSAGSTATSTINSGDTGNDAGTFENQSETSIEKEQLPTEAVVNNSVRTESPATQKQQSLSVWLIVIVAATLCVAGATFAILRQRFRKDSP